MDGAFRRVASVIVLFALTLAAGCETGPSRQALTAENQALRAQMEQLQAQQQQTAAQLAALQTQRAAAATQPAAPAGANTGAATTPGAGTGFGGIEGVETVTTPGRLTVRVPGDVLFASGSAQVRDTAQRTLGQIATVLNREYPNNRIRVEGYTDTDPIRRSRWRDNQALSEARAAAVQRYLATKGVAASRMTVVGYGEANPRPTKAQSRRVEIVVLLSQQQQ